MHEEQNKDASVPGKGSLSRVIKIHYLNWTILYKTWDMQREGKFEPYSRKRSDNKSCHSDGQLGGLASKDF